jgi:hypothetical protein
MSKNMSSTYNKWLFKLLPFSVKISKIKWKDLKNSLAEGYNPKEYGYITVRNNRVINGNHRLTLLKELYPEDHEIVVKTEPFVSRIVVIIFPIVMLIFIVITILLKLVQIVNNLFKIVNNYFTQIFRSQKK